MATFSGILARRIPWTEEPGRLQSIGLQRAGHYWSDLAYRNSFMTILGSFVFIQYIFVMCCIYMAQRFIPAKFETESHTPNFSKWELLKAATNFLNPESSRSACLFWTSLCLSVAARAVSPGRVFRVEFQSVLPQTEDQNWCWLGPFGRALTWLLPSQLLGVVYDASGQVLPPFRNTMPAVLLFTQTHYKFLELKRPHTLKFTWARLPQTGLPSV